MLKPVFIASEWGIAEDGLFARHHKTGETILLERFEDDARWGIEQAHKEKIVSHENSLKYYNDALNMRRV